MKLESKCTRFRSTSMWMAPEVEVRPHTHQSLKEQFFLEKTFHHFKLCDLQIG